LQSRLLLNYFVGVISNGGLMALGFMEAWQVKLYDFYNAKVLKILQP